MSGMQQQDQHEALFSDFARVVNMPVGQLERWLTLAARYRRRQARQMCCTRASFRFGSCPGSSTRVRPD